MGISINNGSSGGGGEFFKPAEYQSATLIVAEPKGRKLSQYKAQDGSDQWNTTGDFTIFTSPGELEEGKPGKILEDSMCSGTLASALYEQVGQVTAGKLVKTEGKNGRQGYWKLAPAADSEVQKAVAYLEAREAAKAEESEAGLAALGL